MTDTTEGTTEAQEQGQQAEATPEPTAQEVDARKLGWRPETEWDDSGGGTWLDAGEFVQRNERLADRGDKILKAEVSSLKREVLSMKQTLGEAADHLKKADARAYKKALKDLEIKADKAVEEGDTDGYRAAKGELKELEQEVKAEIPQAKKPVLTPDDDPVFDAWLAENAWYDPREGGFDAEMRTFVNQQSRSVSDMAQARGLSQQQYYQAITATAKKKFPDRFGNQRRKQAQEVETGSGGGGGNSKTLWLEVPKEARATFKRFVSEGLYTDDAAGREKYAEIYVNQ